MTRHFDANWWTFSVLDAEQKKILSDAEGRVEVNVVGEQGRRMITYADYLCLERLLSSQIPATTVPDERIFIVTHQLIELVFKMMLFDFAVIAETFHDLLDLAEEKGDLNFRRKAFATRPAGFWGAALTASGRLKWLSSSVLPNLFALLGRDGRDRTFDSGSFAQFRDYLPPASGFQTFQFRLIQRALAKGPLHALRVFPAHDYAEAYEGQDDTSFVTVVDRLILRANASVLEPEKGSPQDRIVDLDHIAHAVLTRCGGEAKSRKEVIIPGIPEIPTTQLARVVKELSDAFGDQISPDTIENFRKDLDQVCVDENQRRRSLGVALQGATCLRHSYSKACLTKILMRIVVTDDALHGSDKGSMLSRHSRVAIRRINDLKRLATKNSHNPPSPGTGGGGIAYLNFVRAHIVPLYPALIAFRQSGL